MCRRMTNSLRKLFAVLLTLRYPHLAGPLYPQDQTLPPVYCSTMDTYISLIILACDARLSAIITILRQQGIWAPLRRVVVFGPPIGGLVYHLLCHHTFKAVLSASSSRYELRLNAPLLFQFLHFRNTFLDKSESTS